MMNDPMTPEERRAFRFLEAMDNGDLDTLAEIWASAEGDPALGDELTELTTLAIKEFEEASPLHADAEKIAGLLKKHLVSAFSEDQDPGPVTIGDVAAKIQADAALRRGFDPQDLTANSQLLGNPTVIPEDLGMPRLMRWVPGLGVAASTRYWKEFRKAALLLRMSRDQASARLAAARSAGKKEKPK